ncbi:SCO5717 family growth-regulating ATPase [Streptomyces sp. L7]
MRVLDHTRRNCEQRSGRDPRGWATPGDDQPDDESAIEMTGEFTIDYAPPAWYTAELTGHTRTGLADARTAYGTRTAFGADSGERYGHAAPAVAGRPPVLDTGVAEQPRLPVRLDGRGLWSPTMTTRTASMATS